MRVLLLNTKNGSYFQGQGAWTSDPEAAVDFGGSIKAAAFAQEQSFADAEIYLDFGDAEYNVQLPVPALLKQA